MIPCFKPCLGTAELIELFRAESGVVARFENEFARAFESRHGIAFPYGRSALWIFFKAVGLTDVEIIMPAYTCVVVAHAVVLSGNIPRFVDVTLDDYNMDLDQVEAAFNERTRAVVATHLFGYPLNIDRLNAIVESAERRYGHKVWVVQDCAHSFGARWNNRTVTNERDVALFGLNISKMITSIFGGMLTTNDAALAEQLRACRAQCFRPAGRFKDLRRRFYLAAVYLAFSGQSYRLVHWLQEKTSLLDRLTRAYHLDDKIHFPPDHLDQLLDVEAQVGLAQLRKYPEIVLRRLENARYYHRHLQSTTWLTLPPLVEGATYSHFAVRVPNRSRVLDIARGKGIQLGRVIDYSIPDMPSYRHYGSGRTFPNSSLCSHSTLNLPVYAGLSDRQTRRIVNSLREITDEAILVSRPGRSSV